MVGKTEHHVVNSRQLAEDLAGVFIEEGDIFDSHDVVSLFTNTPIDKTLSIIKNRLSDDKTLKNRTNLNVDDIMELLEFVLTTTYFSSRGTIYKQKFGAAMGSPCSAIIANIFMEWLEQEAIATAPMECKPKMWKRYVDDILEIIKKGLRNDSRNISTQSTPLRTSSSRTKRKKTTRYRSLIPSL
ncbi:uncharacterized protein [Amphiura filiformis]|uniref:uncharacterized protein n=1 Tax=Amphiura filiformis TaxID=82378 RepID=UPI003B215A1E